MQPLFSQPDQGLWDSLSKQEKLRIEKTFLWTKCLAILFMTHRYVEISEGQDTLADWGLLLSLPTPLPCSAWLHPITSSSSSAPPPTLSLLSFQEIAGEGRETEAVSASVSAAVLPECRTSGPAIADIARVKAFICTLYKIACCCQDNVSPDTKLPSAKTGTSSHVWQTQKSHASLTVTSPVLYKVFESSTWVEVQVSYPKMVKYRQESLKYCQLKNCPSNQAEV